MPETPAPFRGVFAGLVHFGWFFHGWFAAFALRVPCPKWTIPKHTGAAIIVRGVSRLCRVSKCDTATKAPKTKGTRHAGEVSGRVAFVSRFAFCYGRRPTRIPRMSPPSFSAASRSMDCVPSCIPSAASHALNAAQDSRTLRE